MNDSAGAFRPCWDNEVVVGGVPRSWRSLVAGSAAIDPHPTAFAAGSSVDGLLRLAGALAAGIDVAIVDRARLDADLRAALAAAGYTLVNEDATTPTSPHAAATIRSATSPVLPLPATSPAGRVAVFSSGTTGRPKLIPHTWASLATMRHASLGTPRTWLVPYAVGTYAWYQCALLGLALPDHRIVPVDPADTDDWVDRARAAGVDAISATPTFWRRSMYAVDSGVLASLPLRQVTLGGEPVDQSLLDRLRDLYPQARLTHIYASSEAGACIVVSDGRAGFPASWLEQGDEQDDIVAPSGSERRVENAFRRPTRARLRIVDGCLQVLSPWAHGEAAGAWIVTGDRVRVDAGRVEVVGRDEPTIVNVGGAKVDCEHVAAVVGAHEAVAWCRVYPRRAPIVGEVVCAEIVPVAGRSVDEDELSAWCRERLADVAVPRLFRTRAGIPVTAALKSAAVQAPTGGET